MGGEDGMLEEGEIEESEEIVGYKSHDIELKRANLEKEEDDDYRRMERRKKKHKKRKRREEEDGRDNVLAEEVQELVEEAPGD